MVVDGFVVFDLDLIRADVVVAVEGEGDFANHVFDEPGVVVGLLGHEFFVWSLEHGVEGGGGGGFDHLDDVL